MKYTSGFSGLPDINGYITALLPLIASGSAKFLYGLYNRWGSKKFMGVAYCAVLFSACSLVLYYTVYGSTQMFQYTGFLWPIVTPTFIQPPNLTTNEASIFGAFSTMYGGFFICAVLGITSGILILKKIFKKKLANNNSPYQ